MKKMENLILITVGAMLDAFGVAIFTLPYEILCGGVTGCGRIANLVLGISVSHVVALLNVAFFLLAFVVLGKKYAASILLGSFLYPLFLDIFCSVDMLQNIVNDSLLATVCGGCIVGLGLGLIIRGGGSSGGSDVPAIILNQKFGWSISMVLYVIDAVVLLMQIPFADSNEIVMAILRAIIYTVVMNKVIIMGGHKVQIMAFSKKAEAINDGLLALNLGTTLLHGKTGYFKQEQDVVVCVFSNKHLHRVKQCIMEIDPQAFLTISSVDEVKGRGFTLPQTENKM